MRNHGRVVNPVNEDQGERPNPPATERAEELVDRMGEGIGYFASLTGLRLLKVAALAREEAEDMWAEAQSLRRAQSMRRQRQEAESGHAAETIQATDVARRTAEELNVDLREVRGTGVNGLITAGDVKSKKKESTG
ncbi:MAG TPA: E3 binding domain-containing protein [Rubrobacter sp.]|nr:E3 binding domain-containing protein [Rubrobacter sp.]